MDDESTELVPKKGSLLPLSADDIVDSALGSLDETQARRVTEKAADEIVRLAESVGRQPDRPALGRHLHRAGPLQKVHLGEGLGDGAADGGDNDELQDRRSGGDGGVAGSVR